MSISGSVIAAIAQELVGGSFKYLFAERPPVPELPDDQGLMLSEDGEYITWLTRTQLLEIEEFLTSDQVRTLVRSLLLCRAGSRSPAPIHDTLLAESCKSFEELARHWPKRDEDWSDISEHIWNKQILPEVIKIPEGALLKALSPNEVETLQAALAPEESSKLPPFVRRITEIFASRARLGVISLLSADVKRLSRSHYANLSLNHIKSPLDDAARDSGRREVLYVSRDLTDTTADQKPSVTSDDLLLSTLPGRRTVVLGDPGVGKSTLVGQLAFEASQRTETIAPVIVRCRELNSSESLVDQIAHMMRADLQLHSVDEEAVADLLATGRCLLIFDGLDEIIDPDARSVIAQRISTLGKLYPLVQLVATARKVGYSSSYFDTRDFRILELESFTPEQVEEYVDKWFSQVAERPDLIERFLAESQALVDVRANPLMLSLLCAVYADQGWLPRNRREIYRECALLLVRRWDTMRSIEVPFDHHEYGLRLMRDLGHFFQTTKSAFGGVEEPQLQRIIRNFFRDTASVEEEAANERASSFLEYCAGRAWLLSRRGLSRSGQRLFGFTHRTFQEYFAAESFVRRVRDPDGLVEICYQSYIDEPSSVLPELIVQAYDDINDEEYGGIHRAMLSHCSRPEVARGADLLLRLLNSSPAGPSVADSILKFYFRSINSGTSGVTEDVAFFSLYRDPRARAVQIIHELPSNEQREILNRWASFVLLDESKAFDTGWDYDMSRVGESVVPVVPELDDWSLVQIEREPWLIGRYVDDDSTTRKHLLDRAIVRRSRGDWHPSLAIRTLDAAAKSGVSARRELSAWLAKAIVSHRISEMFASKSIEEFHGVASGWDSVDVDKLRQAMSEDKNLARLYVWYCLIAYESDPTTIPAYLSCFKDVEWGHSYGPKESAGRSSFLEKDRFLKECDFELLRWWVTFNISLLAPGDRTVTARRRARLDE